MSKAEERAFYRGQLQVLNATAEMCRTIAAADDAHEFPARVVLSRIAEQCDETDDGLAAAHLHDNIDDESQVPVVRIRKFEPQQGRRMSTALERSEADIIARIRSLEADQWSDWLGTQRSELISALPFDSARSWLVDTATPESWEGGRGLAATRAAAIDYYGAPMLKAAADLLGVEREWSTEFLRMAEGLSCDPDGCYEGCGS